MAWAAVAGAAVGLVGSVMSSNAAQGAADTQSAAATQASNNTLTATRETNAMLQNQYNQNQYNQSPWLSTGQTALAAMQSGMGLGNPYAPQQVTPYTPGAPTGQAGSGNPNMTFGGNPPTMTAQSLAPGASPTGVQQAGPAAGVSGATAGQPTGGTYLNAQGQPVDAQGNVVTAQQGVVNYGATQGAMNNAANQYQGQFQQTFTPSDLSIDPSYQWRLQQGNLALQSKAGASGLSGSGQNLKDISNYNQGAASQEYQAAYDRFMNNQNTAYNRLAGLAGVGQTTAANLGSQGASTAGNMANVTMGGTSAANNYMTGAAAANAAGQVGTANAVMGGIGNGLNTWMGIQNMQKQAQPYGPGGYQGTGLQYNPGAGYGTGYSGGAAVPEGWTP